MITTPASAFRPSVQTPLTLGHFLTAADQHPPHAGAVIAPLPPLAQIYTGEESASGQTSPLTVATPTPDLSRP